MPAVTKVKDRPHAKTDDEKVAEWRRLNLTKVFTSRGTPVPKESIEILVNHPDTLHDLMAQLDSLLDNGCPPLTAIKILHPLTPIDTST